MEVARQILPSVTLIPSESSKRMSNAGWAVTNVNSGVFIMPEARQVRSVDTQNGEDAIGGFRAGGLGSYVRSSDRITR
jgi:hypothetical protein